VAKGVVAHSNLQTAICGESESIGTFYADSSSTGVRARAQKKIIFQFAVPPIDNGVDARSHGGKPKLGEVRDIPSPTGRIRSEEIVTCPGLWFLADHGFGVGEAKDQLPVVRQTCKDGGIRREANTVAWTLGLESERWIALALISFEA
jgi:hypothetical protein